MNIENQIHISSLVKAINKAKIYGKLNCDSISLYQLYAYYINYTNQLIENGVDVRNINTDLKKLASSFKYKYKDDICNYKRVVDGSGSIVQQDNTAPTISSNSININISPEYNFKQSDFTLNYNDAEGDSPSTVIIYPSGLNGDLYYLNNKVSLPLEISISNASNLKYMRVDNLDFTNDNFSFKVSDSNINRKYSTSTIMSMNGVSTDNQPATIGDNTIYVNNRTETILTIEMFTTQLIAPYNDPEGDLIDAIRIDEISTANLGEFQLNSVPVIAGQIITRENIIANLFTHVGPDQDSINSDVINFSARDEGSKIWVQ
jgi:hypothetical protein